MKLISRLEAKERGFQCFFTGKPCRRGHTAERYTKSGRCRECEKNRHKRYNAKKALDPEWRKAESDRANAWNKRNLEKRRIIRRRYYHADPARDKLRHQKWRAKNSQKVKDDLRRWVLANLDKARDYGRRWRERNPVYVANKFKRLGTDPKYKNASKSNRRARMAGAGGRIPGADLAEIKRRYRGRCANCGTTERLEFDHIKPLARGGTHTVENLQVLCRSCNLSKGARDPIDWARMNGKLF